MMFLMFLYASEAIPCTFWIKYIDAVAITTEAKQLRPNTQTIYLYHHITSMYIINTPALILTLSVSILITHVGSCDGSW